MGMVRSMSLICVKVCRRFSEGALKFINPFGSENAMDVKERFNWRQGNAYSLCSNVLIFQKAEKVSKHFNMSTHLNMTVYISRCRHSGLKSRNSGIGSGQGLEIEFGKFGIGIQFGEFGIQFGKIRIMGSGFTMPIFAYKTLPKTSRVLISPNTVQGSSRVPISRGGFEMGIFRDTKYESICVWDFKL